MKFEMYKIIICILIFSTTCFSVPISTSKSGNGTEDFSEKRQKYTMQCIVKHRITQDEYIAITKYKLGDELLPEKLTCLMGCLQKKSKMIGKNNEVNYGLIRSEMESSSTDEHQVEQAFHDSKYCYDKIAPKDNDCKIGDILFNCFYGYLQQSGYTPPGY